MTHVPLQYGNIDALPLIHGELAFAMAVRARLLSERYRAVAVELPPSLARFVREGIDRLPVIHAVIYRERSWESATEWTPESEDDADREESRAWYVPIDPCDGIVEALRIAAGERTPVHFVDAEVEQFAGRSLSLPDAHAVHTLGVQRYFDAVQPKLRALHPMSAEDERRERHMAHELARLSAEVGEAGRVLFVCGMAHWARIRRHLERGEGRPHEGHAPDPAAIEVAPVGHDSLFHVLGEMPLQTWLWQRHRSGFSLDDHRPADTIPQILETARAVFREEHVRSLEKPSVAALATMVDYARKLTVRGGRLMPDLYTLVVAAKGTVGNDFALAVLEAARTYPPNRVIEGADDDTGDRLARSMGLAPRDDEDDRGLTPKRPWGDSPTWVTDLLQDQDSPFEAVGERALDTAGGVGKVGEEVSRMTSRTPGARRELRPIKLRGRPPEFDQRVWRTVWNPYQSCSWPPEDVVIETFRSYLSSRALALAGIDRVKVEEFTCSMKDGLAVRETLRDLPLGKLYVKEEPRVPGRVGAVVMIFEEDDFGERYPWRLTWMAEHENESTLAFYATDFARDLVGPGVGRATYGGCMLLYPPMPIPDVWDDLRFERARTPSERLLLAALWYTPDRFVAYLAEKPPAPELQESAARLGKHIVYLPISTLSKGTVEKIRRFHVLNGHQVRSWAARFIR